MLEEELVAELRAVVPGIVVQGYWLRCQRPGASISLSSPDGATWHCGLSLELLGIPHVLRTSGHGTSPLAAYSASKEEARAVVQRIAARLASLEEPWLPKEA
jgi:hypothetical protein